MTAQGAEAGDVGKSALISMASGFAMQGLHEAGIPSAAQGRDPLDSTPSTNSGGNKIATEFTVTNPETIEAIPALKAAVNHPDMPEIWAEMAQDTYEVKGPFGIGRERGRYGTIDKRTGKLHAPKNPNTPLRRAQVDIPRRKIDRGSVYDFSLHTHHSIGPVGPSAADLAQPEPGLIIHANRGTVTGFCGETCISRGYWP